MHADCIMFEHVHPVLPFVHINRLNFTNFGPYGFCRHFYFQILKGDRLAKTNHAIISTIIFLFSIEIFIRLKSALHVSSKTRVTCVAVTATKVNHTPDHTI